ncbi:hypothetical protein MHB54_01140 [Paenibacillus sp. FSL M7-0802]|jgi:flagellar hook assembly protein FlgD|uniref:hypothetical protein n=1 Tax=Paenibacillus sp. FSL M7-0802 TaxID=2921536 RepID=UPI0030FC994F
MTSWTIKTKNDLKVIERIMTPSNNGAILIVKYENGTVVTSELKSDGSVSIKIDGSHEFDHENNIILIS